MIYICDLIESLSYSWVQLSSRRPARSTNRTQRPQPAHGPCGPPQPRDRAFGTVPIMPAKPPTPTRFLTLQQVAEGLNVSRSQVYALVRDRSLIAVKIGGRGQWRVERARLEDYIDQLYRDAAARDPAELPEADHDPQPDPDDA